jgi:glucosamine-6-phosphate deaminase
MITIQYLKNYEEMSRYVATLVSIRIQSGEPFNIGTPTGATPVGMYKELVAKNLNWNNVRTFNLDEYVGIDIEHSQSYHKFMWDNLHRYVGMNENKIHFPHLKYDAEIESVGGLDLTILGIGTNGHIAFNEPGSKFGSITRVVDLSHQTIIDNSRFFHSIDQVPTQAITMGLYTIMKSRQIILLAQGQKKLNILKKALWETVTEKVPASILQFHPNLRVFYCD